MPPTAERTTPVHRPGRTRDGVGRRTEMDRRAVWALRWVVAHSRSTYDQRLTAIGKQFDLGIVRSGHVYKRMLEIEREQLAGLEMPRLAQMYLDLYDDAVLDKKYNTARLILDSLADKTGNSSPIRIDIEHSGGVTVQHLAHVAVLRMTPSQRAARERALLAQAEGMAIDALDGVAEDLTTATGNGTGHG